MTDIRRCDGPECEYEAPVFEEFGMLGSAAADGFIVVTRPHRADLHFHTSRCMTNWTLEETSSGSPSKG